MIVDGDLVLKPEQGFAYQADLSPMDYSDVYLAKFTAYDRAIEAKVLAGRIALIKRHLPLGAMVLDYGAGDGAFVREAYDHAFQVKGYEVIPEMVEKLKESNLYAEDPERFEAVTAWDVLEHLPRPQDLLRRCDEYLFLSVPIFTDLTRIRESKHYRPNEHLFYWTDAGLVRFLVDHGFKLLERSSHEEVAGRESICAYAFKRQ